MEPIKTYLDNVFSSLPQTVEILNLKAELESNMLDKYEGLQKHGKSKNEAIGIVISEFGDINELLEEMNISPSPIDSSASSQPIPSLNMDTANEYLKTVQTNSKQIGIGVFIILFGVSLSIALYGLIDARIIYTSTAPDLAVTFPIIFLLFCVALSVSIFIKCGHKDEHLSYIEKGNFVLSPSTKAYLTKNYTSVNEPNSLILGVTLCLLSPSFILIGSHFGKLGSILGVSILLLIVGLAVFIFIQFGNTKAAYKRLLHMETKQPSHKDDKVLGAISSVIWPMTVCLFLILGFIWHLWYICWIVFPITGILFGGFAAFYNTVYKNN